MRYVLLLEGIVIAAIGAYLLWPDATPTTATAMTAAAAAPMGFDDLAWQASIVAIKALPALLVVSLIYILVRVLPRALERHHQVALVRAQRQAPEHVTSYSPHVTYSPRYPAQALPRTLPMLEATARPLPLNEWYPACVQHPAHILLLGDTGSGKSCLARALLTARARTDKIAVIDPHGLFNDWCGITAIGSGRDFDAIEQALYAIDREFDRRYKAGTFDEPLTVFLDEYPSLSAEKKDAASLVVKWLREARKAGIRIIMLSTGAEVKTLGIEGQGSVRENFLMVRQGEFAIDVLPEAERLPYPAVLVRGKGNGTPRIIDTTGMPSLSEEALPADVVWQPAPAITMTDGAVPSEKRVPHNNSSKRDQVIALHNAGESLRSIQKQVFGYAGGAAHDKVEAILRDEGLI